MSMSFFTSYQTYFILELLKILSLKFFICNLFAILTSEFYRDEIFQSVHFKSYKMVQHFLSIYWFFSREEDADVRKHIQLIHATLPDDEIDSTACRFGYFLPSFQNDIWKFKRHFL